MTRHTPRLLVALHDVAPRHAARIARAEALFATLGIERVLYLLVPNFHGDGPAHLDAQFVEWCSARRPFAVDWCLHGFLHREVDRGSVGRGSLRTWFARAVMTGGEGEFLGLDADAAEARLRAGIEVYQACLHRRPHGFIPPAWLSNPTLPAALSRVGIGWTEDHRGLTDVIAGRQIPAPVITWASRSAWRLRGSIAWAPRALARAATAPVLRIAVHPHDFDHPPLVDSIRTTLSAALRTHRVVGYGDALTRA